MYIFYLNIVRNFEVNMRKVPYSLDSAVCQSVCHRYSLLLGNCKNSYFYFVVSDKIFYFVNRSYLNVTDLGSIELRIAIKSSLEHKASSCKIGITCKGLAKVSCADDNQAVLLIKAEDLANLVVEILYVVAISLLAKAAKIVKVLPYLRSCNLHDV